MTYEHPLAATDEWCHNARYVRAWTASHVPLAGLPVEVVHAMARLSEMRRTVGTVNSTRRVRPTTEGFRVLRMAVLPTSREHEARVDALIAARRSEAP